MKPAIVLAGALAILGLSHLLHATGRPATHGARPVAPPAPIVLGSPAPSPAGDATREPVSRTAPRAAVAAARAFLDAYLPWSDGDARRGRALRASSGGRLWALLRSGRGAPQPPRTIAPAAVESLVAGRVATRRAATILAVLRRARRRSELAVVVRRTNLGWRVTDVGP